jgi:hypothetical protein
MLFRKLRMTYHIRQVVKDMKNWPDFDDIGSDRYRNLSWQESDGWRGMDYDERTNKFYFNDYPEPSFTEHLDRLFEMGSNGR